MMVTPSLFNCLNSSIISSPCLEFKLPVGSSANNSFGLAINALAMPTSCCCPPLSCAGNKSFLPTIQQSLFPATIELAAADAVLLKELLPDMNHLGYQLEPFGNNTFVIQGTPADVNTGNEKTAIEKMLEQYKHFSNDLKFSKREKLLRSLALQQSVKAGSALTEKEMKVLVDDLFNCAVPNSTANGRTMAPSLPTAMCVITVSGHCARLSPTMLPGPRPSAASALAKRLANSSSLRQV